MNVSANFKQAIEDYLRVRAIKDDTFGRQFIKEGKSIDQCCTYILNKVKESGQLGMCDDEVYGLAVDYYDEDNIDAKYLKPIGGKVVVNRHIGKPKEEPKPQPTAKPAPKAKKNDNNPQQLTLF